uniref:NADH-quinone oxidoreductase, chain G n=1 Tax=Desulfovibrio sp. U5L TaxID=596152 RepID=I2PZH0_9BACT
MPDLIIDGRPVTVAKGKSVLEAAEALGIMIPRFCWHPALSVAGACRMCAVMFVDGPVKGLEMSCMTPAADGMVVETFHPEAVAFRRNIIELLMVNHPHDCPVCDEGGHCLLQDETISGNHGLRRWPGRKRTYLDQDLGPFIQHEMNRCIHCYRCARFYQDYAGYLDFGPMQNANRVYFGRFESGPLESPFAGNLADLCPTGALTDKTARYKSRRWDCERAASVCPHCSLGCNTVALSRYRQVVRIEGRLNPAVNGYFLCDRGRFSSGFESNPARPRQAAIDRKPAALADALCAAAGRLAETVARHEPAAVGVAGSVRSSLETQAALAALARAAGWTGPAFFPTRSEQAAVGETLAALTPDRARSMADLTQADAVLCLGVSPLFDAPMLGLALRQAVRQQSAAVVVADPRPVSLPLAFDHLPVAPRHLPAVLAVLTGPAAEAATQAQKRLPFAPELWPVLEKAAKAFAAASRPALVFGPALAGQAAALDDGDGGRFGFFPILPGPNAAGAALLAGVAAPTHDDLADGIEAGRIKALVVAEADVFATSPRLAALLDRLETLVVCDHLPTPTVARAHVFLPTATLFEAGGIFVNNEGRLQRADPVQAPGLPVLFDGHGDHPPRPYDRALPGTDPRPGQVLCAALAGELRLDWRQTPLAALAAGIPALTDVDFAALPEEGLRPDYGRLRTNATPADKPEAPAAFPASQGLAVILDDALFGTEEFGRYAPLAVSLAGKADTDGAVLLHADDAAALGLADGEAAVLEAGDRLAPVRVRTSRRMARGVVVVPRLPQFSVMPATLGPCGLRRK